MARKRYGNDTATGYWVADEPRVLQNYPRTKATCGIVLHSATVVDTDYISNAKYKEALRIGIEQMLEQGKLQINDIIWRDIPHRNITRS